MEISLELLAFADKHNLPTTTKAELAAAHQAYRDSKRKSAKKANQDREQVILVKEDGKITCIPQTFDSVETARMFLLREGSNSMLYRIVALSETNGGGDGFDTRDAVVAVRRGRPA